MAKKKDLHVRPAKEGGWKVTRGGKTTSVHRTQSAASETAKKAAKGSKVKVTIHTKTGRILSKSSHGVEQRVIRGPVGRPSVSTAKISRAAREILWETAANRHGKAVGQKKHRLN